MHFQVPGFADQPKRGFTETELLLIAQFDTEGNHNGGDLHFWPRWLPLRVGRR